MKIHFTERMKAIAYLFPKSETAADIGADHGLLSIYLAREGLAGKIYACDINESPLLTAKENIEKFGCGDKVIPVLSDGLSFAHDKAETVIIAGLGGDVISYILEKDDISKIKCFILQPMSKADTLRETLVCLGLKIEDEILVSDMGRIYAIIKAVPGKAEYTPLEMVAGPVIINKKGEYFSEYALRLIRYEESRAKGENGEIHKKIAEELKFLVDKEQEC
ncbi:MAG: SAM-dependent methyltransferase [Clostridia bacterium]|nr:SAM-dependent methyltransferase [Clostridia bacterium]